MTRIAWDKLMTILGASLLGYALGISLFRGLIWKHLLKFLPAINHRHLPDIYAGLLGAVVVGVLGYLLFNIYVQKNRRTSLVALALLFLFPLSVIFAFRIHAVSIVKKQEATNPFSVKIETDGAGETLMFAIGHNSASGISKRLEVPQKDLDGFGEGIRNLQLQEIVEGEKVQSTLYKTIWLNYNASNQWYSKIIRYHEGLFGEAVAGSRMAYYTNPELEKLIEKVTRDGADIANYATGIIVNTRTFNEQLITKEIKGQQFEELINYLQSANFLEPGNEKIERLEKYIVHGHFVPQDELNIYGIEVLPGDFTNNLSRNIMIYDALTKILFFEGQYYQADLDWLI